MCVIGRRSAGVVCDGYDRLALSASSDLKRQLEAGVRIVVRASSASTLDALFMKPGDARTTVGPTLDTRHAWVRTLGRRAQLPFPPVHLLTPSRQNAKY